MLKRKEYIEKTYSLDPTTYYYYSLLIITSFMFFTIAIFVAIKMLLR